MNYSVSEENHIKHIYHLQQYGLVNTNSLAEKLQTKPASVTDMLKKLRAKKILQYQAYKGFKLTEGGNKLALSIIRKHRLWEYFLVAKLGFEWDKVHDIAEQLEHINSPDLINKLDDFLGNPEMDPHGDLIPTRLGKIPLIKRKNLLDAPVHRQLVICAVANQSAQMLQILKHYQLGIGSKLKITNRFSFDQSLEIKMNQQPATILSEQVAKNIFVYDKAE